MAWYERELRAMIDDAVRDGADMAYEKSYTYRVQQEHIWFRFCPNGVARIALERAPHRSEGFQSISRTFDPFAPNGRVRILRMIRGEVEKVAALQQRDRVVASHGHDPRFPPPWAFKANRIGLTLARHAGFTDDEMCRVLREPCGGEVRIHQCGKSLASLMVNRDDAHLGAYTAGGVVMFRELELPGLTYHDDTSRGPVLKMKATLPESVLLAIPGLDVSAVVDHAALSGATGTRIRKVVANPGAGTIELVLKDVLECVADEPSVMEGVRLAA